MKKVVIGLLLLLLFSVGVFYFWKVNIYTNTFLEGTEYAGVDISGLTVKDAEGKVKELVKEREIKVLENGKEISGLKLGDIAEGITLEGSFEDVLNKQNKYLWFLGNKVVDINSLDKVMYEVNRDKVVKQLEGKGVSNKGRDSSINARLMYDNDKGYIIKEEEVGNEINFEELVKGIKDNFNTGDPLTIDTYYIKPDVTSEDEELKAELDNILGVINSGIKIVINGEDVEIPSERIEEWLYLGGNGEVGIDYDSVYSYVEGLNDKYSTYGKGIKFMSSLRGEVDVQAGNYGWSFVVEDTANAVYNGILGKGGIVEPVIQGVGYGKKGVGDTYIEVDLENQKMFYIASDGLQLETDIVSGMGGGDIISPTDPGVYFVWDKKRSTVLTGVSAQTGEDYDVPVEYWMPFDYTGQGIHDAPWHTEFGGDRYLSYGSQGCINVDPEVMAELYDMIELNTPVVVY